MAPREAALEKENHPLRDAKSRGSKGKERAVDYDEMDVDAPEEHDRSGAHGGDGEDALADPATQAQNKRTLRGQYRSLQTAVEQSRNTLLDTTVEQMAQQVEQSNELFKEVQGPAEAVLDSHVLMAVSDAGALKARQLKLDANAFDTDEFLGKIKQFLGFRMGLGGAKARKQKAATQDEGDELAEEEDDDDDVTDRWVKVGRVMAPYSLRLPTFDHMWGPLSTETKEKKAREKKERYKPDEKERVRPEELGADDVHKDPQETTKMVAQLNKVLQNQDGPVAYLKFIINPDSFPQTVENMFYFAFLIKEGRAAIEQDDDEQSEFYRDYICFSCEPASADDQSKGAVKQQLIFELTEQVWRDAIKAYDIDESIIPHRAEPEERNGKW